MKVVLLTPGTGSYYCGVCMRDNALARELIRQGHDAIMLPMYVVSGVFFPADRFPDIVQPLIQILPLTAVNDALRAVMNEGKGFEALLWPALILGIWGSVSFTIALRIFRWR